MQTSEITEAPQPSGMGSLADRISRDERPLMRAEMLGFWVEIIVWVSESFAWM